MNRRIVAVFVALALLLGGFVLARQVANTGSRRPGVHKRVGARVKAKRRLRAKRKARLGRGKRGKGKRRGRGRGRLTLKKAKEPITPGAAQPVTSQDPPNVVLIIGCTVRADQLTPYGGHPRATPFLAERAAEGVMFRHGVVAAPWTKAASAALLTGHHPAEVGMVEPGERPSRRRLSDEVDTLAERFAAAGYVTVGATANPNLNEVFGFAQGFDTYLEGTQLWRLGGRTKVHGRGLLTRAIPQIARAYDGAAPLYAQFLFTDAHAPSTVQRGELAAFEGEGPKRLATYRAMLRRFDMAVEVLVKSLAHQGITEENTVFVVVNDHGEGLNLPAFHGKGHGNYTYPSTARMPWIVWGAGVASGHVVDGMASQIDVYPTLAELTGIGGYEGPGLSWADAVRGEVRDTTREHAFVDTWFQESRRSAVYTTDLHCHDDWNAQVVDGVRRVPRACYDQDAEPEPVEDSERTEALLAELDAFRTRMEAAYAAYPYTGDAKPPDDVVEELEALGYVEGGDGAPE